MINLKKYWKDIAIVFLLIIVSCFAYYEYKQHQNVPIATIKNTSAIEVAEGQKQAGVFESMDDAIEKSKLIEQRTQKPPDYTFYTNTQKEADTKAQQLAKQDKSDYILKQTETKPVNNDNQVKETIENKYYSITQDKKNQINVGVTAIEKNVYLTAGYQHDKLSIYIHSKDLKQVDGATVLYTVNKW